MTKSLHRHLELLGLEPGVSFGEIQNAFRCKAKVLHPDVNHADNAQQLFRELLEAYKNLKETISYVAKKSPEADNDILVVSKTSHGDFRTIGAALQAARDGHTILVKPGRYQENIVIEKDVTILGDEPTGEVEIVSSRATVVEMRALRVVLRNLIIRATSNKTGEGHFAVAATTGLLEMEDCDISSLTLSGVVAYGELTDLVMRRCQIHGCHQAGIYAYAGAHAQLSQCRILDNLEVGLQIEERAQVKVRECHIQQGPADGVVIENGGHGEFDGCEISHHARAGIRIRGGATPVFRRCRIHDCRQNGIVIHHGGLGAIEDCDIFANAWKGLRVHEGGRYIPRGMVSLHGNGSCSL